jgi:hypothetical protein
LAKNAVSKILDMAFFLFGGNVMEFSDVHAKWLTYHLRRRRGERLRRLQKGYLAPERLLLEKVIFPVLGSLHDIHPEFEVNVPGEAPYFLDFALIRSALRVDFELDGYGPHQRDASRYTFSGDRRRDAWLRGDGWIVLRFSYDDVVENAALLQKLVRRLLVRYEMRREGLDIFEVEVLKFALSRRRQVIKVAELIPLMAIGRDRTRKLLREMASRGILRVMGDEPKRVHRYELNVANELVQRYVSGM